MEKKYYIRKVAIGLLLVTDLCGGGVGGSGGGGSSTQILF